MPKFGSYAIIDDVVHHFEKEPKWYWKIKPPTSGAELEMSKFALQNRVVTGLDGMRRELPPTSLEIAHREVALTFGGTNIPMDDEKPFEDGGDAILKKDASIEDIERALRQMPHEMVMEIWYAVGEACPTWGPSIQKVKDPNK